MAASSSPPLGEFATPGSSSAAIAIPLPQYRGRCHCPCNCGCAECSCRTRVDIIDRNREEYGGEGTPMGGGDQGAITQPMSYTSSSSANSVKESSNAPMPTATTSAAPPQSFDTIRALHGRPGVSDRPKEVMNRFMADADDACPWDNFLETSITDDTFDAESGMFWPVEIDGSTRNHAPFSSSERSMLSSFMSSLSLHAPSAGASDVLRGVGNVFGPRGPMRLN